MPSNPSASPSLVHRLSHSILTWVIGAILLALLVGSVRFGGHPIIPKPVGNVFATFSDLFSQFLSFSIPLIIIGLVTPPSPIWDAGPASGSESRRLWPTPPPSSPVSSLSWCAPPPSPRLLAGTSLADVAKPEGALAAATSRWRCRRPSRS